MARSAFSVVTISTSAMTGTGLKKCMPSTRSGCLVALASRITGIDEVLVARIASAETISHRVW